MRRRTFWIFSAGSAHQNISEQQTCKQHLTTWPDDLSPHALRNMGQKDLATGVKQLTQVFAIARKSRQQWLQEGATGRLPFIKRLNQGQVTDPQSNEPALLVLLLRQLLQKARACRVFCAPECLQAEDRDLPGVIHAN